MKPSEFEIFFSVESYDKKTPENCQNCCVAEKRIVSKLSRYKSLILITHIEDLNKHCVKILNPYINILREISRQISSRSGRFGLGQSVGLDQAGPVHCFK